MTIDIPTRKLFYALQMLLLVSILGLLLWSQPWDDSSSTDAQRTITVTGEATVTAEPDEFTFRPNFEQRGTDQEALKTTLTDQTNKAVDDLKALGVEDKDIKLDVSSYEYWYWNDGEEGVLNAYLDISISGDELVQSVQDYLLNTEAKGQLTPRASFSDAKRKELDAQAVKDASADARAKAEAQAELFGAKLGDVVTIDQGSDSVFGFPYALEAGASLSVAEDSSRSLPVLQGEQDYRQTVNVVYELQ